MRTHHFQRILKSAVRGAGILLWGAVAAFGQQQINLTAGAASVTLPDGSSVPMWGYSCGTAVLNSTATCAKLNPAAAGWSPIVITVPTTASGGLAINLTNNLPAPVPTSIMIVGQLGGGLGTMANSTVSPAHPIQPTTWPVANAGAIFTPPVQGNRVQSFSKEVGPGATAALPPWANLRPGTYLIESGTHPSIQGPMGLYGMLVVTCDTTSGCTTGTAYPGVSNNADAKLLFSEIDPAQNAAVAKAVATPGFSETATVGLYVGGSIANINLSGNGGGSNYTTATVNVPSPPCTINTTTCIQATATAVIDTDSTSPTYKQITEIDVTNAGAGYTAVPIVTISGDGNGASATAFLALGANGLARCSGGAKACYPPAVNYTPLYYLINGVAFDKTHASASMFPTSPATAVTGKVLVRMVNAGLRMHVPSIVGAQTGVPPTALLPAPSGFSLIAEDGNLLPGVPRVQNEVFLAAGKTYDVMINAPGASATALPIFDRQGSTSGNATARDAGMLAYISVNGAALPSASALGAAVANADTYNSVIPGKTLTVSDPAKGVIANDVNVYGVKLVLCPSAVPPRRGTPTLNLDGTFAYVPDTTWTSTSTGSFCYQANGNGPIARVTLGAAPIEAASGITVNPDSYTSAVATALSIKAPGVLLNDTDAAGYPLTVSAATVTPLTGPSGWTIAVDANGGFIATVPAHTGITTATFTYNAVNSQGTSSTAAATVTLTFPAPSNLSVMLVDGKSKAALKSQDYRWIIEEDRTWYQNPNCTSNPLPAGCPGASLGIVPAYGTNFHTSYMPVIAQGCVGTASCEQGQTIFDPSSGQHVPAACDIGNGVCRAAPNKTAVLPGQTVLNPAKRYYLSVMPGDAINGNGHSMGGAELVYDTSASAWKSVNVIVEPEPLPTATVSAFVFEDDFPLNGEQDAGGGVDVLAPNEPGLGGFQVYIYDNVGQFGDPVGQMTYDMFNMPLSNALAGTIDPATGLDACPVSANSRKGFDGTTNDKGITGMIITCPFYESDGKSPSPLAGQAVVRNLPPGFYGIEAVPGADRIGRGEEWLQTNTLDGGFAHDSFIKASEPSYFQEYGPAGFHVAIGFANPAIINGRKAGVCANTTDCTHTIKGKITLAHMSRTPDERLYSSSTNDAYSFTQTYVSLGSPDGADFAFVATKDDGTWEFDNMPSGDWRITVFDQWTDLILDGYTTPVRVDKPVVDMGDVAIHQWRANIYTRTFFDLNGNGIPDKDTSGVPCTGPNTPAGCNANYGNDTEPGLTLVPINIRYTDGSYSNFNNTDLAGYAAFNEIFPLFNWYVVEADTTRYKNTGTHVVYDAGGPVDGSPACAVAGVPACGNSTIGKFLARTKEDNPLPADLRVPGSVYCDNADCTGFSIANGPTSSESSNLSTGRIDPPWVLSYGWQGFLGQANFLEIGKKPFAAGENGGIKGHVVYASTRPFDDPQLLLQTSWEPLVPGVTINLYQEGTAPDGSQSLKLVDTTKTSSWDDWAQGFRSDGKPNMSCPGQSTSDPFFFTLYNQPNLLNLRETATPPSLPYNSQYKCYDGMHNWNQLQPAPYDGYYQFPSVTGRDPQTGKTTGSNCTICTPNHAAASTDFEYGQPMLPVGKYVVEMIVPTGYELVKEEDKNILMGDAYNAAITQEFAGLGNIFILPDQASVAAIYNANQGTASGYNANNAQNPTQSLGRMSSLPSHEGDTGSVETYWPCVGAQRIVPDYMSLYPGSQQVSPFAGATRNLCDRKEVILDDQTSVLAKFYVFSSAHVAGHITGIITDDFTAEFDPFSPAFGEKFQPPYLPVGLRDWAGNEVNRVYTDQWGIFSGLLYSSWGVNPPDPSGFVPQTFVMCMNDRGDASTPDPLYNPSYSQFCYEWPVMPGTSAYLDTPVVPNTAFAEGYNHPDCDYPDKTPAISQVNSQDGTGPWVSAAGHTLTITALGDQQVTNYGYSGPSASTAPFNQKTVTRHYGFGAQCTSPVPGNATCNTVSSVTIGGVNAAVTSWSDTSITVTVPSAVPMCAMQQQAQYGGSAARCGQLAITAGNGKQSIDTVTVTIGGKAPTRLTAGQTIQSAIDAASPGDLIIVPPGSYKELLLMWKPVGLQGVGAVSSIINGDTHPSGVIDPWRRQVNCLFGLALNGQPYTNTTTNPGTNPYDSDGNYSCPGTGWQNFTAQPNAPQVDRIPMEGILGWDVTVNGNLAEMLQEPTLMGSYEGAGITVLAKGVRAPASTDVFGIGSEAGFPAGTTLLTGNASDCGTGVSTQSGYVANPFPSNFLCNPARIDGLEITNSSQGGGGIYLHGWGHNVEISNNRVQNNNGTLTGGIQIGQGEFGDGYLQGNADNPIPGSCQTSLIANTQLPYCFNMNVNIHNNSVTLNSSTGDELFTSTPAGAGAVTFCVGSDYYKFNYNWICGNMSSGDGGGVAHLGFSYNGDIEHNTFMFNQSTNPTVPTNGGGLVVMGAAPDGVAPGGVECGSVTDVDCIPGLPDGIGPGLVINANLFMGNSADAGSGGGIRFQAVNGTEVSRFPLRPDFWYEVNVTNNIITNNVAGWDGAGVSILDALKVNLINNTIVSNDTTASSGTLFNAYFAPLSSDQSPPTATCTNGAAGACTASTPQPAGVAVSPNSPQLITALSANVLCPAGHSSGLTNPLLPVPVPNGDCRKISFPVLYNNLLWQNRSFHLEVGGTTTSSGNNLLQSIVTLQPTLNQPSTESTAANGNGTILTGGTGACVNGASYWDIGVRGDTGPTNHSGTGITLAPVSSVLTDLTGGYGGNHNSSSNPAVVQQYCNGSRMPPEFASGGYQVPPGTNEGTVPVPVFSLLPGATVDEGNNWISMKWGPLSTTNPVTNTVLGNYALASGSPSINYVTLGNSTASYVAAPNTDFFGNGRKGNLSSDTSVDVGAVEFVAPAATALANVTGGPLSFGNVVVGTTSAAQTLVVHSTGTANVTGITVAVTAPFSRPAGTAGGTCATATPIAPGGTCSINVVFSPTAMGAAVGTVTITANVGVTGSPVNLSGAGVASSAAATVAPNALAFSNTFVGATSAAQTLTITNTGTVALTGGNIALAAPFSRATILTGGPGTCQALGSISLAAGASCTVNVVFSPATAGPFSVNAAVTFATAGTTVTGSPVALTGTTHGTFSITAATNGTLSTVAGVRTLTFTIPAPRAPVTSVVTISNIGGGNLSITAESLSLNIGGLYSITGTTCSFTTPLAPGGACTISIRYATPATQPLLADVGALLVTTDGTASGTATLALSAR
jgi:hypothetical protein